MASYFSDDHFANNSHLFFLGHMDPLHSIFRPACLEQYILCSLAPALSVWVSAALNWNFWYLFLRFLSLFLPSRLMSQSLPFFSKLKRSLTLALGSCPIRCVHARNGRNIAYRWIKDKYGMMDSRYICDRIWKKGALHTKRVFLSLFNLSPFQGSESLGLQRLGLLAGPSTSQIQR